MRRAKKIKLQNKVYPIVIIISLLVVLLLVYIFLREPVIVNIAISPTKVTTDDYFSLNLEIKNNFEYPINLTMKVNPSDKILTDIMDFNEIIPSKKSKYYIVKFYVNPDLASGKYPIIITFSYKDINGKDKIIYKQPTINVISKK